jgi:hypothetical protein
MLILIFSAAVAIFLSLSRRKFGFFTLTLMAGLVLDDYWNGPITDFLTTASLNIPLATLSGVVGLVLICVPAVLVLGKSAKNDSWATGVISSVLVAGFMTLVVLPSFSSVFTLDTLSLDIANTLIARSNWVILAGFVFAILDNLSFRLKK